MPKTTGRNRLQHRPFATLRQHLDNRTPTGPQPAAGAVRAEIRALVARGALSPDDGQDVLARLGLASQPYRWAAGAQVPVTVTVQAPNDAYAEQVGAAQIIAALGRMRTAYLASRDNVTGPTDHPMLHSLRGLRCRRTDPCPGYPVGGVYKVAAEVLLAVTVTAADAGTAWATARSHLADELDRVRGLSSSPRMRRTGLHQLTYLDHPSAHGS
jgi:hypothetical protein